MTGFDDLNFGFSAFIQGVERSRTVPVDLTRAHERRLRENIRRYNEDVPSDVMDPQSDKDLAIALLATSERGLDDGDTDIGVWVDMSGKMYPLPRPRRAPVRMRLRFAARAAARSWRST